MSPLLKKIFGLNWFLLIPTLALLIFGVYVMESAARHLPQGGAHYAHMQKVWVVLGSLVYLVISLTDYRFLKWLALPVYIIGIILMLILVSGGNETHQLTLFGFSFQPTQVVIASGILLLGTALEFLPKCHRFFSYPAIKLLIIASICGLPFMLVMKDGDTGSAIVWIPVAFVTLLIAGIPFRYLTFLALILTGLLPLLYYFVLPKVSERATGRIEQYLQFLEDGEVTNDQNDNYAPYYVTMAVAEGGWKGLGHLTSESLHAERYIPWKTTHNDYIFAVIAGEHGFRGSLLLILTFFFLLVQCLFISFCSRDFSGQIISGGVVALFFAHIFENIGMCVLLVPITGIPMPLVSYSGTFMLICMFLLGVIQSIWVHRNNYKEEEGDSFHAA